MLPYLDLYILWLQREAVSISRAYAYVPSTYLSFLILMEGNLYQGYIGTQLTRMYTIKGIPLANTIS